ncbi:hypothetical protein CFP65_0561 [Kitasatospora sp. MMS16-BH015]|uniref:hypothetical protein n=1 Tax=Kitasatospora sp. MMS16-BH015 TaxID=2018025 RepID=UPI000CA31B31|nr:hypothetical protein [Kitasatospora sp. MMS16-BH015]AUG75523.1 hypothetical protein CFP65_0561 [Kitasatospora sp. MMS16-BH015]
MIVRGRTKGTGKGPLVALALAAGVATVVLGVAGKWPAWLWAVPLGLALVLAMLLATARPPAQAVDPDDPPWEETRVIGVALPSRVPDYDFLFSATVWWRPIRNSTGLLHADPAGLAAEAVLARARAVTERAHPDHPDLVLHRLNAVLGTQGTDESMLVEAMGGRVELRLSEEDRSRLGRLSEVRKTGEVWEHERRQEQSKRAYLGEDVLRTPGSAAVWWLARHEDRIQETVDLLGPLAQLSAAANDAPVDELYHHLVYEQESTPDGQTSPAPPTPPSRGPQFIGPVRDLLEDSGLAPDSPEWQVLVRRIANAAAAAGRADQARAVREHFLGETDDPDDPTGAGSPGDPRSPGSPGGRDATGPGVRWAKPGQDVNGHPANGTSPYGDAPYAATDGSNAGSTRAPDEQTDTPWTAGGHVNGGAPYGGHVPDHPFSSED